MKRINLSPVVAFPLATSVYPFKGESHDLMVEVLEHSDVAAHFRSSGNVQAASTTLPVYSGGIHWRVWDTASRLAAYLDPSRSKLGSSIMPDFRKRLISCNNVGSTLSPPQTFHQSLMITLVSRTS